MASPSKSASFDPSGDPSGLELSHSRAFEERLRPAFWILAATVVIVPLAMAPGLQYFDVTPKLVALAAGACLVWIALAAANRLPAPGQDQKTFFRLLWAMAAAAVLSTVFSRDAVLSLAGTEGRRLGLPALLATLAIAAAVPSLAGTGRRRRLFVAAIALTGVAAAVYGIAQYLGVDPWIDPSLYRIGGGESLLIRPPATLGHANFFAIFLLLALFSAIGLGLSSGENQAGAEKQVRWGWTAAAAVIGLGLAITGSRAGWLGGAAGAGVVLLRAFGQRASEQDEQQDEQTTAGQQAARRAVAAGLAATAALGLAFLLSPWGQPLRNRIVVDDPGITARGLIWRDTMGLLAAHPLLGSGPDTFELAFAQRASPELARLAPDQYAESPHNVFLESFVAGGLPGGLLFLALMLVALRGYLRPSSTEPLGIGLLAAFVAGLAAAQFSGETMATRLGLLTFAALSVSAPLAPVRPADRGMAGGIGVACLAVTIVFGSRMVQADRALFAAREAASQGDLAAALEQGRGARAVFPWTGVHSFAFSRVLGQLLSGSDLSGEQRAELLDAAEEAARAGMLHASQPQAVLVHRASLEVLQGREQAAGELLESAIEEAPTWYRPRWLLAVLLAGRGELGRAAEQAGAALELGAQVHPEIAESCGRILEMARAEEADANAREIIPLSYDDGLVEPSAMHPETPNGRWAFPYTGNSIVTLPQSTLTFRVDVPAEARFLAVVRMPLPGADPARAVVRINGEELFTELAIPQTAVNLDLSRYAGQSVELQLGAEPTPQGQRAAWVQWLAPRIVAGAGR